MSHRLESTEYPSQLYHIFIKYNIDLLLFNPQLIALMPTSSTQPSSSSQPRPSSPTGHTHGSDFDGSEEVGAAVWKRRYVALQESVNTEKSSKRKSQ